MATTTTAPRASQPAQVHNKPRRAENVLLLLADDLGIGDLSIPEFFPQHMPSDNHEDSANERTDKTGPELTKPQAGPQPQLLAPARTPNLARLAREGTIMTSFYTAGAVCTPTRASILTSRFPFRFNIRHVFATAAEDWRHPAWLPRVPTMPQAFRSAGFVTGHVGKWHLGGMAPEDVERRSRHNDCTRPGPAQHGFDNFVSMEQGHKAWYTTTSKLRQILYTHGAQHLIENDRPIPASQEVVTDQYVKEAEKFMDAAQRADKRFYLQVWFHAPHWPVQYVEPEKMHYAGCMSVNDRRRKYLNVVAHLDAAIGDLMHYLDRSGLSQNTLVMFVSDNGPEIQLGSAGPYKGRKRHLFEGGIRVPAMVRYPGVVPVRTVDNVGVTTDILHTVMAAADVPVPKKIQQHTDGVNLWPMLLAANPAPLENRNRIIMWASDHPSTEWAARKGDFKMVRSSTQDIQFYNIRDDPFEMHSMTDPDDFRFTGAPAAHAVFHELAQALDEFSRSPQRTSATDKPKKSCAIPRVEDVPPFSSS